MEFISKRMANHTMHFQCTNIHKPRRYFISMQVKDVGRLEQNWVDIAYGLRTVSIGALTEF